MEGGSPGAAAWLAVSLVSLSTLVGAWLARRHARRVTVWLAVSSALMLVTAVVDLLPDAWHEAVEKGVPLWGMGLAIGLGFLVVTYFTRKEHVHTSDPPAGRHAPGLHRRIKEMAAAALFGGVGTAAALTVHRVIEGATLALSASAVVVIALVIHSAGEGLAIVALLDMAGQRLTPLLLVACASPLVGMAIGMVSPMPSRAVPILLGVATGILSRTALLGLKLAASRHEDGRVPRRHVLTAATVAATVALSISAVQWIPGHAPGAERPTVLGRVVARPRPNPAPTPPSFRDKRQLRGAFVSGALSLAQLFARTDRLTRRIRVAWLLRGHPRYDQGDIADLLFFAGIGPDHTIGDLDDRQRAELLAELS
ncbi:hypothetical protein Aph01nite_54620 [Acrocarpospora phusangensis]|uniref:Zinc transporter ZupT n=1 Tax=Acrocarpospora phusangensis TaxID=1070424 RepID=A0A919UQR1_9ACTN|nr:hypothetical protein [Acrocarpospora phusangensis]GIH27152.1 hypothetical protein Aph01nite_54620 [Acrocarpospora phusangensis]